MKGYALHPPFLRSFQQDVALKWIAFCVVALHVAALIVMALQGWLSPLEIRHEKVVVKTIQLQTNPLPAKTAKKAPVSKAKEPPALEKVEMPVSSPSVEIAQEIPSSPPESAPIEEKKEKIPEAKPEVKVDKPAKKETPPAAAKAQPKKEPPSAPAKTTKKKETTSSTKAPAKKAPAKSSTKTPSKTPAKTKETATTKNKTEKTALNPPAAQNNAWIEKAQASLSKLKTPAFPSVPSSSSSSASSALPLMPGLASLHIDAIGGETEQPFSSGETGYVDELVSRLKLYLKLPEYGDVQVKLTLERSGRISKVAVTKAKSAANRTYVEKTLPSVSFPAFGNHFNGKSNYTFSLILSNES